ncbi:MAG: InlB B-repeat-containing protein, partial [Paludibacteraceae bacterium]|nr:InlB B-repeat-containing protein [Paludibacteraceae bacterium]
MKIVTDPRDTEDSLPTRRYVIGELDASSMMGYLLTVAGELIDKFNELGEIDNRYHYIAELLEMYYNNLSSADPAEVQEAVNYFISYVKQYLNYYINKDTQLVASYDRQYVPLLPIKSNTSLTDKRGCQLVKNVYASSVVAIDDESVNHCNGGTSIFKVSLDGGGNDIMYYAFRLPKTEYGYKQYPLNYVKTGREYQIPPGGTEQVLTFEYDVMDFEGDMEEFSFTGSGSSTDRGFRLFNYATNPNLSGNTMRLGQVQTDTKLVSNVVDDEGREESVTTHGYGNTGEFEFGDNSTLHSPYYIVTITDDNCRAISSVYDYSIVSALVETGPMNTMVSDGTEEIVDPSTGETSQRRKFKTLTDYKVAFSLYGGDDVPYYFKYFDYDMSAWFEISDLSGVKAEGKLKATGGNTVDRLFMTVTETFQTRLLSLIRSFFTQNQVKLGTMVEVKDVTGLRHICNIDRFTITSWYSVTWELNGDDEIGYWPDTSNIQDPDDIDNADRLKYYKPSELERAYVCDVCSVNRYNEQTGQYVTEREDPKPLPEKESQGYRFAGWYDETQYPPVLVTSGVSDNPAKLVMYNGETRSYVFTARWVTSASITWLCTGGYWSDNTNTPYVQSLGVSDIDVPQSCPNGKPIKTQYVFMGWQSEDSTSVVIVNDVNNDTYTVATSDNCTVYPIWEEIVTHIVTFNVSRNGGIWLGGGNEDRIVSGEVGTLAIMVDPTHNNPVAYEFIGWNKESDATTGVDDDTIVIEDTDQTYYAIYKHYVAVTFNVARNGGKWPTSDSNNDLTMLKDENTTATPEESPVHGTSPESYRFVGWNTDSDAHTGTMPPLNVGVENITYYAIFEYVPAVVSITFNVARNGGMWDDNTTSDITMSNVNEGDSVQPTKTPTHQYPSSYTFLGWNTNSNAHTGTIGPVTAGRSDETYYAIYEQVSAVVTGTFNVAQNGGNWNNDPSDTSSVSITETQGIEVSPGKTPTHPDAEYSFVGWSLDSNASDGSMPPIYAGSTNQTYYAIYRQTISTIKVTFNVSRNGGQWYGLSGGEATDDYDVYVNRDTYVTCDRRIVHSDALTNGFAGWSTNPNSTTGSDTVLVGNTDVTLYAIFITKQCLVTLTDISYGNNLLVNTTIDSSLRDVLFVPQTDGGSQVYCYNGENGYVYIYNVNGYTKIDLQLGVENQTVTGLLSYFIYSDRSWRINELNSVLTKFNVCYEQADSSYVVTHGNELAYGWDGDYDNTQLYVWLNDYSETEYANLVSVGGNETQNDGEVFMLDAFVVNNEVEFHCYFNEGNIQDVRLMFGDPSDADKSSWLTLRYRDDNDYDIKSGVAMTVTLADGSTHDVIVRLVRDANLP